MVNAYLFGGPADGAVTTLEESAKTLDVIMDDTPYTVHKYIIFSTNDIGASPNQIFKYEGVTE